MLSKETFCEALRKIQAQKDRDEQFGEALASTTISAGGFTRPPQATKSGPMMKKPSGA